MSQVLRRMMGPPMAFHPNNPHSGLHWEYDSCTTEPPHCKPAAQPRKPMPTFNSSRPNHYAHDSLGDPLTCTEDHNHPAGNTTDAGYQKLAGSPRASALDEAKKLITGDRNNQYGPPTQDFQRTADLLNALGYHREDAEGTVHEILSSDVAIIISQVKVSRIIHSRGKRDSWVDLAGYAACGYECAVEEADGEA